jgi:5'-3' exonuclease
MTATAVVAPATGGPPMILVDLNHLGFRAQLGGQKLTAGEIETTGIYGFMRMLRVIRREFAGRIVCLHDGHSWRYEHFSGYKANRKSDPKLLEAKDRWKASKPWVVRLLRLMNVDQVAVANMEADDLAARIRRQLRLQGRDVVLVTGDQDWLQLVGPGAILFDAMKERIVTEVNFQTVTGLPHPKAIAEMKALMGDSSDCIPGVGGIGEKTATALLNAYGSVTGFTNAMMADPAARKVADKRALKLLDDADRQAAYERNLRLIWLDHPDIPVPAKPNVIKGRLDKGAFAEIAGELAFHSILKELDTWLAPFTDGGK